MLVQIAHQLFSDCFVTWRNQRLQLSQQYLRQCFPRGNARQRVKFLVPIKFYETKVIGIIELLAFTPAIFYRKLKAVRHFTHRVYRLREAPTVSAALPIQTHTTKETDALLFYLESGILQLLLIHCAFQLFRGEMEHGARSNQPGADTKNVLWTWSWL